MLKILLPASNQIILSNLRKFNGLMFARFIYQTLTSILNLRRGAATRFAFVFCAVCFVAPCAAQPTSIRDFNPSQRRALMEDRLEKTANLTGRIIKDNRNVALYRERLRLYYDLFELNFDNGSSTVYADKFEADLSRIIELEETPENYLARAEWLGERLRRSPPPEKIAGLYPANRYFDKAVSDYLKASRLDSSPQNLVGVYKNLSGLYAARPQKLVSSPSFPAWRARIPLKLVRNDFANAVKFGLKALNSGTTMPYAGLLKESLAATYRMNIDAAVKFGDYQTALEFYESGKNYFGLEASSSCAHYAAWGGVYLKLKQFDKAIETFDAVSEPGDAQCADLFASRGDAFAAKREFERALSDYDKALALDAGDSLEKTGWVFIKKAKLLLRLGKTERALSSLNAAAARKYVARCPRLYRIRAEVYRRLGKKDLAAKDLQNANKLQNQANCPRE